MTTDFISSTTLDRLRRDAKTPGTVLLFGDDAKNLLALLDAQRAALEKLVGCCYTCDGRGLQWRLGGRGPCPVCAEARKLLEIGVEDGE